MAETRRPRLSRLVFAAAAPAAFFSFPRSGRACPMCAQLLEHGRDAFQAWCFGKGIAWSILVMLLVPYLMVGGLIFYLWRANRAKHARIGDPRS